MQRYFHFLILPKSYIIIKQYLSKMQGNQTAINPASKFLIMHPFFSAYQLIRRPKYKLQPSAQQTSKNIHTLMIKRGWKVFGGEQDYNSHLINKKSGDINRKVVLAKLGEMFRSDSYENLAIFLIAHGHKHTHKQYNNFYHWIEIETGRNQSQFIELRQILNLWKPITFKHLFIALYACNADKITNIMMQYKTYSTISILTTYDQNNQSFLFPDGNCTLTKHLFGLTLDNPQFKQIVDKIEQKQKIIGYGHHQRWVMILSESYQIWSKSQFIRDIIYHTDKNNPSKVTSKYFGGVWRSKSKFLKHGKGFMDSQCYFFEGRFYFKKFRQGRLYKKALNETSYGTSFNKYEVKGKGCVILEDKENMKKDRIIIGNFPLNSNSSHFYLVEKIQVSGHEKFINLIIKNSKYQLTLVSKYDDSRVQQFQDYVLKINNKQVPKENRRLKQQYQELKKHIKKSKQGQKQTQVYIFFNKTEAEISLNNISAISEIPKLSFLVRSKSGKKRCQSNFSNILTTHHLSKIFDRYCYIQGRAKPQDSTTVITRAFTLSLKITEVDFEGKIENYYAVDFNSQIAVDELS